MPVRRPLAVALAAAVTAAVVLAAPRPARAASVSYSPPVDAPISTPFEPPSTPFGPGNRGLDYWTTAGQAVAASGDGEVVFAGQVGGTLHVTILHADGLRTSYSFLDSIEVRVGESVRRGERIGTASAALHFGVRDPDGNYLDPAQLFAGRLHPTPHLVPGAEAGEPPLAPTTDEGDLFRAIVRDRIGRAVDFGSRVAGQLEQTFRTRVRSVADLSQLSHVASIAKDLQVWYLSQSRCTAAGTPVPPPAGRRILVEVGGIGSTSDDASITKVDTGSLGYAAGDVVQFSYGGGRTPPRAGDPSPLAGLPASGYTSADTEHDLHLSADRLHQLVEEIAASQPGVPIDIVAHSQGGVVGRMALEQTEPPLPAEVRSLVTLGSPHHGANLATAVSVAEATPGFDTALDAAGAGGVVPLDPAGTSVGQLAETSPLIDELNTRPLAPGVHLVSVGASGDLTVPAPRTLVDGAGDSTVVDLAGLSAHDDLPGSAAATREIGLAVAGLPPTCRSFGQALRQAVSSEAIDTVEDDVTAAAANGGGPPFGPPRVGGG